MGVRDLEAIRNRLLEAGWPNTAFVTTGQHLGWPEEDLVYRTLETVTAGDLSSPAVILVGPRPHAPSYTLFTGTDPAPFLKHGPLLHLPMISLRPTPLGQRREELTDRLDSWDGLVFPSSRAVEVVVETLMELGDLRLLSGKHLLAVGPMTADALRKRGLRAEAFPSGFGGVAALAEEPGLVPGVYGYPTSDLSPVEARQQAVKAAGIQLAPWVCYTHQPIQADRLPSLSFHRVLFTSASTVNAYFEQFPDEKQAGREWVCVGTSTLNALQKLNLKGSILH
jgi:uroporphyrinogen III methyltransferase/synthase